MLADESEPISVIRELPGLQRYLAENMVLAADSALSGTGKTCNGIKSQLLPAVNVAADVDYRPTSKDSILIEVS